MTFTHHGLSVEEKLIYAEFFFRGNSERKILEIKVIKHEGDKTRGHIREVNTRRHTLNYRLTVPGVLGAMAISTERLL